MRVLGIDPGITGWWCIIDSDKKLVYAEPLPFCESHILLKGDLPQNFDHAYVEKIHINAKFMPASSAFKFGFTVGQIHAYLSDKIYFECAPKTWQSHAFIGACAKEEIKSISRSQFVKLNPEFRTKSRLNHNMTDAFHIAHFGLTRSNIIFDREYRWSGKQEIQA